MLIAIPSMGRAGKCSSYGILKKADPVFFVPAHEASEYRRYYPRVEAVPNETKGITRTRNFILDWASAKGIQHIVQADDDAIGFFKFEGGRQPERIDDRAVDHFERMFLLAEDLGTVLWGFQVTNDSMTYREYCPFSLTNICVASCIGIVESGMRFDERLNLKEDYDFSLQVLLKYRKVLRSNKYTWFVRHQFTPGGCSAYRSMQAEQVAIDYLRKKWGKRVVQINRKKSFEIVVRVPLPGV